MKEIATGAIKEIVKQAILAKRITPDVLVMFSSLVSLDQPLDEDGNTAMLLAFMVGEYSLVEMLLKRGYSPNTQNKDGYSVFILIEETINEFEKSEFLNLDDEMLVCYNLHQVMTSCYFPRFPNPSLIPTTWRYPIKEENFNDGDRAAVEIQKRLNETVEAKQQTKLVQQRVNQLDEECDRLENEIDRYRQLVDEIDQDNLYEKTILNNKVKGYHQLVIQLHDRLTEGSQLRDKLENHILDLNKEIKEIDFEREWVISDNRELMQLAKQYKDRIDGMSSMDGRHEELVERNEILKDGLLNAETERINLKTQLNTKDSWLAQMEVTLKGLANQHQILSNNYNKLSTDHQKLVSMIHQYIIFHDYILEVFPEIRCDAPIGEIMGDLEKIADRDSDARITIDRLCRTIRLFESRMDAEELNEMLILVQDEIDLADDISYSD